MTIGFDQPNGSVQLGRRAWPSREAFDTWHRQMTAYARRELSPRDLAAEFGIHQAAYDALPVAMRREIYVPKMAPKKESPAVDPNPLRGPQVASLIASTDRQNRKLSRAEYYEIEARKWDAQKETEALAKADAEADAREREPVVLAAHALLDKLKFSNVPIDDVIAARNAVRQAETPGADIAVAQAMLDKLKQADRDRTVGKRAELRAEIAELDRELGIVPEPPAKTKPTPEPEPEPTPEPGPDPNAGLRAAEERLRLQEWTASREGAVHSWDSMKDLPYEERWARHEENLRATGDAPAEPASE